MGTRNLTCVYIDGEYKVAQYGQFDGYPEGVGFDILDVLHNINFDTFKEKCRKLSFYTDEEIEEIDDDCKRVNYDHSYMSTIHPHLMRNLAGRVLDLIHFNRLKKFNNKLHNRLCFAQNSLECEFCYVIDFDSMTFEVYGGANHEPLKESDRFYIENQEPIHKSYYGVKLLVSFDLNNLPENEDFKNIVNEKREVVYED